MPARRNLEPCEKELHNVHDDRQTICIPGSDESFEMFVVEARVWSFPAEIGLRERLGLSCITVS